jgi:hypothetical protein
MAVHNLGGIDIGVRTKDNNYFFYRRQGVSIRTPAQKLQWCWFCPQVPIPIDSIDCSIELTGVATDASASGSCQKCGSLNVMGPKFWGFNVPQAYQNVAYNGRVKINGQLYAFSGVLVFS